jgi:hypothetical protein
LAAGLTIDTINVLGNEATVRNPAAVEIGFWIAWLYFLSRYAQYHHDFGNGDLLKVVHDEYIRLVAKRELRLFSKTFNAEEIVMGPVRNVSFERVDVEVGERSDGQVMIGINGWVAIQRADGSIRQQQIQNTRFEREPRRFRSQRIIGWINASVKTRFITEFFLPYLIASSPLVFLAWKFTASALQ